MTMSAAHEAPWHAWRCRAVVRRFRGSRAACAPRRRTNHHDLEEEEKRGRCTIERPVVCRPSLPSSCLARRYPRTLTHSHSLAQTQLTSFYPIHHHARTSWTPWRCAVDGGAVVERRLPRRPHRLPHRAARGRRRARSCRWLRDLWCRRASSISRSVRAADRDSAAGRRRRRPLGVANGADRRAGRRRGRLRRARQDAAGAPRWCRWYAARCMPRRSAWRCCCCRGTATPTWPDTHPCTARGAPNVASCCAVNHEFPPAKDRERPTDLVDTSDDLKVLRYMPQGPIEQAPHISVTFSHPMVVLSTVEQVAAQGTHTHTHTHTHTSRPSSTERRVGAPC